MNCKKIFRLPFEVLKRIISYITEELNEYKYPYQKRYKNLIANYKLCGLGKTRENYLGYLNIILQELIGAQAKDY